MEAIVVILFCIGLIRYILKLKITNRNLQEERNILSLIIREANVKNKAPKELE